MDRMKICYNFRAVNYCEISIQFQLIDQSTGVFRCEKCNKDYPNFMYRLLASVCIASFEFYILYESISFPTSVWFIVVTSDEYSGCDR